MIEQKFRRRGAAWACLAVFVLLLVQAVPQPAQAGVCAKALQRCVAEQVVSGILSFNVLVLLTLSTSCALGYEWCLLYYIQ